MNICSTELMFRDQLYLFYCGKRKSMPMSPPHINRKDIIAGMHYVAMRAAYNTLERV